MVVTETCGGTMSGYCATGIASSEIRPAIAVTIAMTIASRGRSTKTAEIIAQRRSRVGAGTGDGEDRRPGRNALHALHDHLLAAVEPALDDDVRARPRRRS